jgi:folate-binding protein YgfZ
MNASFAPEPTAPALAAARDGAVVCALDPAAVLAATGPDAAHFLHGQLSSDVEGLAEGAVQLSSFNSPKGRMLANFALWREAPTEFRLLVPADIALPLHKRLSMYVLRSKVTLADISAQLARFGVGGPRGADALRAAGLPAPGPLALARGDGATVVALPGPRFVVLAPAEAGAALAARLGTAASAAPFEAWQWLAIRAGVPEVTLPVQDTIIAQTANWDVLGGVNFRKGCYTGQEIIARMHYLGKLKERLFAFHAAEPSVPAGTRVYGSAFGDQACGLVVNAAPAPGGGADLLAVVQLAAAEAGDLRLASPDGCPLELRALPYDVPPPEPPRGRAGPRA